MASHGMVIPCTQEVLETYTDMFQCYQQEQYQNWTIFRLPLRTKEQAKSSAIFKQECNLSNMKQEIEKAASKMPQYLLFLKNVKEIKLFVIPENGNFPITEFSHFNKTEISLNGWEPQTPPAKADLRQAKIFTKLSEIVIENVKNHEQYKWIVSQQYGYSQENSNLMTSTILDRYESGYLCVQPIAAVALMLDPRTNKPISRNENQVYFYLPLPFQFPLPVIINGHWVVDDSRRSISLTAVDKVKSDWNLFLSSAVVGPAYANLLKWATQNRDLFVVVDPATHDCSFSSQLYFSLFPQLKANEKLTENTIIPYIISGFVNHLKVSGLPVVPAQDLDNNLVDFHPLSVNNKPCIVKRLTSSTIDNMELRSIFNRLEIIVAEIPINIDKTVLPIDDISPDIALEVLNKTPIMTPVELRATIFETIPEFCVFLKYIMDDDNSNCSEKFALCVTTCDMLVTLPKDMAFMYKPQLAELCPSASCVENTIDEHIYKQFGNSIYNKWLRNPKLQSFASFVIESCLFLKVEGNTHVDVSILPRPFSSMEWICDVWNYIKCLLQSEKCNKDDKCVSYIKSIFWNIAILPVNIIEGNEKISCLVPLSMSHLVVKSQVALARQLKVSGIEWSLYELQAGPTSHTVPMLTDKLCVDISSYSDVLTCLHGYYQKTKTFPFDDKNKQSIMEFFNTGHQALVKTPFSREDIQMMLALPIHKSLNSTYVSISSAAKLIPLELPDSGLELLTTNQNELSEIYIKPETRLYDFYKNVLQIQEEKLSVIYISVILPEIYHLSSTDIFTHLKFLKEKFFINNEIIDQQLKECLQKTPLIKENVNGTEGDLFPVNHYFVADKEPLLNFMLPDNRQLPGIYRQSSRHTSYRYGVSNDDFVLFFTQLGLKVTVTLDEVLQLSTELANSFPRQDQNHIAQYKIDCQTWNNKSHAVLNFVIKTTNETWSSNKTLNVNNVGWFLQTISRIHFFYSSTYKPMCYSQSYAAKYEDVISEIEVFLPREYDPEVSFCLQKQNKQFISALHQYLGIISEPTSEIVFRNLIEIVKLQDPNVFTYQRKLVACLEFFEKKGLQNNIIKNLSTVPCVLLDSKRFVTPPCIVEFYFDNLLLFAMPPCYKKVSKILQEAGSSRNPQLHNYLQALKDYSNMKIDLNILSKYQESAQQMFGEAVKLIISPKFDETISSFYFFISKETLLKSDECYYCDIQIYEKENMNIPLICTQTIDSFDFKKVIQKLPENLKPKALSTLLSTHHDLQEFDDSHPMSDKAKEHGLKLVNQFNDENFIYNIIFIFRHFYSVTKNHSMSESLHEEIEYKCRNVNFLFFKRMIIKYEKKENCSFEIPPLKSIFNFHQTIKDDNLNINVTEFYLNKIYWFYQNLTKAFTDFVDIVKSSDMCIVISKLLSCSDNQEMDNLFLEYKISKQVEVILDEKLAIPGELLKKEHIAFLQNDPSALTTIRKGDMIAYQKFSQNNDANTFSEDKIYVFAKIAKILLAVILGNEDEYGRFVLHVDPIQTKVEVSGLEIFVFLPMTDDGKRLVCAQPQDDIEKAMATIKTLLEKAEKEPRPEVQQALRDRAANVAIEQIAVNHDNINVLEPLLQPVFQNIPQQDFHNYIHQNAQRIRNDRNNHIQNYNGNRNRNRRNRNNRGAYYLGAGLPVQVSLVADPHPNLTLAQKWLKQAKLDLLSEATDRQSSLRNYEWSCIKSYQAAEKALKAVYIYKKGFSNELIINHSLVELAAESVFADNEEVTKHVSQLEKTVGSYGQLLYPFQTASSLIPHELFNETTAQKVQLAAEWLVEFATKNIPDD